MTGAADDRRVTAETITDEQIRLLRDAPVPTTRALRVAIRRALRVVERSGSGRARMRARACCAVAWNARLAADREARDWFETVAIRMLRNAVEALANSEEGRHEDYQRELAEYEASPEPRGDRPEPCPAYAYAAAVLSLIESGSRYVTIRIDSAEAAADLYYAVCSGTFQLDHLRSARRVADALRERVRATDPDLVRRWPAPSGS